MIRATEQCVSILWCLPIWFELCVCACVCVKILLRVWVYVCVHVKVESAFLLKGFDHLILKTKGFCMCSVHRAQRDISPTGPCCAMGLAVGQVSMDPREEV